MEEVRSFVNGEESELEGKEKFLIPLERRQLERTTLEVLYGVFVGGCAWVVVERR